MSKRAPIIEVHERAKDHVSPPVKRPFGWLLVSVLILLFLLLAGGYGWLRTRRPPLPPPTVVQTMPVATITQCLTGTVAAATAARTNLSTEVSNAVKAPPVALKSKPLQPSAILVKVTAPKYAAAYLADVSKRVQYDTNAWERVQSFPYTLLSVPPGPRHVSLEADGFACSALAGANETPVLVDSGRTNEVEFVLTPIPATLSVSCNVTNAIAEINNQQFPIIDAFSVPSLCPLTLTVSAPGHSKQTQKIDNLVPGVFARRDVTLERESGALRIEATVPTNATAYYLGQEKLIRLGANAWVKVSALPHLITGLACRIQPVALQVDGFEVSRVTPAEPQVWCGQTTTVTFVTMPGPAQLTVCCNVTNALLRINGKLQPVSNTLSVPSLCSFTLAASATGYVAKAVNIGPLRPSGTYQQAITLEPVPGSASSIAATARKAGKPMSVELGGGVPLELVWIPSGEFLMGSPEDEPGRAPTEGPQHRVRITKGFWMGKYEVTQTQWKRIMAMNPSRFKEGGLDLPVENVDWEDCQEFLLKVETLLKNCTADFGFPNARIRCRLPTEAEWEYACRADSTAPFNLGPNEEDMDRAGWYGKNSRGATHPVGRKEPNAWGLYDMHGNVWELCGDRLQRYTEGVETDPRGFGTVESRPIRGGGWNSSSGKELRSARRYCDMSALRSLISVGFRMVVSEVADM